MRGPVGCAVVEVAVVSTDLEPECQLEIRQNMPRGQLTRVEEPGVTCNLLLMDSPAQLLVCPGSVREIRCFSSLRTFGCCLHIYSASKTIALESLRCLCLVSK
jgi:hypothetical protein